MLEVFLALPPFLYLYTLQKEHTPAFFELHFIGNES
jgi:hypothetical protein